MTRPLSEQVAELQELFDRVALECDQRGETIAELEAKQHHLWDVKEAIRVENFELWSKNERLEAERDRLKADAISDLIKHHWLENQVRNREAERDDLQRQVQEARDEIDGLRSQLGIVTRERDEWEANAESVMDTLPRVIDTDELREGQTVVVYSDRRGVAAGMVYDLEPDFFRLDPGFHHSRTRYRPWMLSAICGETIVLLEDAPQPTGYADDDHQDAEITDWHKPHRVVFQRASEAQ